MQAEPTKSLVGEEYEVEIGPVAHGGHCIARTSEARCCSSGTRCPASGWWPG